MLWLLVSAVLEVVAGEGVAVLLAVGVWLQPVKAMRVAVAVAMDKERNACIMVVSEIFKWYDLLSTLLRKILNS
ncbi:hypothetical protein [Kamptonema sp. UHCC 0994]|uniref:hypothetical protein n=1 Tax=Kamptonema sp. UHCC 0994 TaxID=3031329 RepID=UPI0023B95672|nr:hypothetical protein [Kamptonema sp. UHCC 0994]MDF0553908.1 hypothetical protein [Kamptonema sp. UHCC 0994]